MRANLLLLLTATIWGTAFVAQSVGMDHVGPFTFICVRYLIGGQKSKDIASYYEKNEKKALKWIEDIISAYED